MNKHFDEVTEQQIHEIEFAQEKEQAELDYFEISDELSNAFQDAM